MVPTAAPKRDRQSPTSMHSYSFVKYEAHEADGRRLQAEHRAARAVFVCSKAGDGQIITPGSPGKLGTTSAGFRRPSGQPRRRASEFEYSCIQ